MITKEQLILENEKNNKILSLMEELDDIREQYNDLSNENNELQLLDSDKQRLLNIYIKEFGEYIECTCEGLDKDCMICKGKGFYFNKQK